MSAERSALADLSAATTRFLSAELGALGDLIECRDRAERLLGRSDRPTCNCGAVTGFHAATCPLTDNKEDR